MSLKDYAGGDFIKFAEWGNKEQILTIKSHSEGEGFGGEKQLVLSFKEIPEKLGCNGGAIAFLRESFGDDEENLPGKRVVVYGDPNVMYKGKRTGGIRLKSVQQTPYHAAVAPVPAAPTTEDASAWKRYCYSTVCSRHPEITDAASKGVIFKTTVEKFFPAGTDLATLDASAWKRFEQGNFGMEAVTFGEEEIPF